MTTDPLDDPIRQMADRGYTLVRRLTHRYAGENLAVCGAEVPDPCPECGQPDEVRDAALALVDEWDMPWSDEHPLRSHYLNQAQDRLRATLDRLDR